MLEKPTGGIETYDLLNSTVKPDEENEIIAETLDVASKYHWGIMRCRMAVIINRRANQHSWRRDYERRATLLSRFMKGKQCAT